VNLKYLVFFCMALLGVALGNFLFERNLEKENRLRAELQRVVVSDQSNRPGELASKNEPVRQSVSLGIPLGDQESFLMLVLIVANSLVALSYASIPLTLVVFVMKRKDIPFSWVFVLFSAFILACGTTHAMHAIGIWQNLSMSWWQAGFDSLTALISVFSAIAVWPLLPRFLAIPSPAQLRAVNQELQQEKASLIQAQNELQRAYAEVEERVQRRTADLFRSNRLLQAEIVEHKQAKEKLAQYSEHLEEMVEQRTRELRETQEQLILQEKLALLGRLAGSVAHELRNPLGVINNAVYYLRLVQPQAEARVEEYLDILEAESRHADQIITDLVDYSRSITVEAEAVSLAELVRETLKRYPVPENVQVTLDLPENLPKLFVDLPQIVQVLGNLVVNACQALEPAGGRVTISGAEKVESSAPGDEPPEPPEPRQVGRWLLVTVKDTGPGIPPENLPKLFEPLFTTKLRGIGLGLPVSRKLVEAHGGTLEATSQVGQGANFILRLPVFQL
jgi:signal transduction histidine kinase